MRDQVSALCTDISHSGRCRQVVQLDLAHAGYGTYVTHRYSGGIFISECSDASVVMLKVLVYSSWAMTAFNWYACITPLTQLMLLPFQAFV